MNKSFHNIQPAPPLLCSSNNILDTRTIPKTRILITLFYHTPISISMTAIIAIVIPTPISTYVSIRPLLKIKPWNAEVFKLLEKIPKKPFFHSLYNKLFN
jgi:hypothetical protein